ncbi:hypothetical protein [Persephonella sp.]|uniref:hypothetical protein n=1 Tax=Persephonella sp. TaxID=2060922 RepID=UPI002603969F|nr:hypothetical protein [Persephonella sp.]
MIDPKKLKKLRFEIDEKDIKQVDENFLKGIKHIKERHYTEAIKWLQLSECPESPLIIAALAFKVGDEFLFEEYIEEPFVKKCGVNIYLIYDNNKIPLAKENLLNLKEKLSS